MRNLFVCIFALVVLCQAVESLECYHCPNGGRCFTTATCRSDQDQCITLFFAGVGFNPPKYAKRCGKQSECDIIGTFPSAGVKASCCGRDLCNR